MASVSRMLARKLVAETLALVGALYQTGDVDKLNRGRHDAPRVNDVGERLETVVGHVDDTHVGVDRGKRIVGGKPTLFGERSEERLTCPRWAGPRYRWKATREFPPETKPARPAAGGCAGANAPCYGTRTRRVRGGRQTPSHAALVPLPCVRPVPASRAHPTHLMHVGAR